MTNEIYFRPPKYFIERGLCTITYMHSPKKPITCCVDHSVAQHVAVYPGILYFLERKIQFLDFFLALFGQITEFAAILDLKPTPKIQELYWLHSREVVSGFLAHFYPFLGNFLPFYILRIFWEIKYFKIGAVKSRQSRGLRGSFPSWPQPEATSLSEGKP